MKKICHAFLAVLMVLCIFASTSTAFAQYPADGWDLSSDWMTEDENGNPIYVTHLYTEDGSYIDSNYFRLFVSNAASNGVREVTFTSSNPKAVKIDPENATVKIKLSDIYCLFKASFPAAGSSVITASVGDQKYTFTVIVQPYYATKITSVKAHDYKSVQINWKKTDAATGYIIARAKRTGNELGNLEILKHVDAADGTSVIVPAPHNTTYGYCVIPKLKVGTKDYYTVSEPNYYWQLDKMAFYKLSYKNAKITKLAPANSAVTINWATHSSIKQYKIYRRKTTNSPWQLIYTENKASVGSRTVSAPAGQTYIYKIDYIFPEYTVSTNERSCYVPKKATKKKTAVKLNIFQDPQGGQYGALNSANRDNTFYYERKNAMHVVCRKDRILYDYTLKPNGKVKSKKKIKLCNFYSWGGIYYGEDDNIYVAVGYQNPKESKKKTVIKVMKYSPSWKLQKTCNIAGGVSNSFYGICSPFASGNVRFQMRKTKLYMVTSRTMFAIGGVNHQSNISFLIDTKTMTYKMANDSYVSHSFNQYVSFDADNLYLADHGDAYDRGINLTVVKNYGTKNAVTKDLLPFKIKGKTGYNYTGLTLGGLETTADNILTVGTSVPQDYTVAGVTGNKDSYKRNVFMTVTDKNTLKSKVKWLTSYNPKKSKVTVCEVRTVKLSDDAVVIMYTTVKKSKSTLHYMVVNNDGNVTLHKTYKNMEFTASSQPLLFGGAINWVDIKYSYKKVKQWGMTFYDLREKSYYYKIPAITK